MRRKLLIFFILILCFGVSITGFVSYSFTKNWIVETTRSSLKSEAAIIQDLIVPNSEVEDYDELARHIKTRTGKRITIIKEDGEVLGESDYISDLMDNHLNRPEVQQALKVGEGVFIRYSNTDKNDMYYYAIKSIVNNKTYIIRVAMKFDDIKSMQSRYLKLIVITISIGIILSSILVYLYVNLITNPIRRLTRMATTISLGNYEKRVNVLSRDEIGQIGDSFNLMAERLQETIINLADEKNKLISILTSSDDGIIVVDKDEKILLINPAAQKLFGISVEAIGKYFIEVIRNTDIENIIKNIPTEDVELTINYPKYKHLRIKASNAVNYDKGNEVIGVLIVIHDITKIRSLEKMRSDFIANVSHELKTPLTSIKGFAETLKCVEDKPTRDKFLDIINVESERLTRLINDILTLSEIENKDLSFSFEKVCLNKSLEEVFNIMKPLAENKNITLRYNYQGENIIINANPDKFKQMSINIIDNAIKYTNSGGKVEISLTCNMGRAEISVKDTGIGISKEDIPRLFERFYRVDKGRSRTSGGTGLGLAIVKHIVISLRGEIKVQSRAGEGTVFTIYLPVVNSELT
jgi:two-component system, OmpR family, phosphate regulon sensor histidine kinase PhoR